MAALSFKIISFNIGGSNRLAGLPYLLKNESPDLVMLQEIHYSTSSLNNVISRFGYISNVNNNPNESKSLGTAFCWKEGLPLRNINTIVSCRLQSAELFGHIFLNVYAPSGLDSTKRNERHMFFAQDLFMSLRSPTVVPIIGGDFNCILHEIDTEANAGNKLSPALLNIVNLFNYIDVFRSKHPGLVSYTWHRPNYAPARLDRFYVPQNLITGVQSISHHASLSDHYFVEMNLCLPNATAAPPRKMGSKSPYWKLNTSILKDKDFTENFEDMWEHILQKENSFSDVADWWDLYAKPSITKFCQRFSKMVLSTNKNTKIISLNA